MTRMYLTSDETARFDPAAFKGAWDKTSAAVVERLSPTRHGRGFSNVSSENSATNNFDVLLAQFVSDPLSANTTISGTLDAILLTAESNADANDVLHVHAWVTQGNSSTVRGTLLTDFVDSTEWAVSALMTAFSAITMPQQTLSSVAAQAGDRVVVEIGYQAQNTHTTSRNGGIVCGGRTNVDADGTESAVAASSNHVPWVEFSTTLAFTPRYLYVVNEAAPATPGATRGAWDVDNHADSYLRRDVGSISTLASRQVAETSATNPTDGLIHRVVSDTLAAQTITASTIHIFVNLTESATDADAFTKIHLYVMKSDGSVRGTLLSNLVDSTELTTLSGNPPFSTTLSSLAVLSGDRLVLEIGARFTNTTTSSRSATSYLSGAAAAGYGSLGTSGPSSNGSNAGWLRFAQHILFADEVATAFPYTQIVTVG